MAATADAISGLEKVAIVLISMGPGASAEILKHFSEQEVENVTSAIARLGHVDAERVASVLEEFHRTASANRFTIRGGAASAQQLLTGAFGADTAARMVDRVMKQMGEEVNFDAFRNVDPQQFAGSIQGEHPQTIALVLSRFDAAHAARILKCLPPETQPEIAHRMATLDQISPEVARNVATVVSQKLRSLGDAPRESFGGVRAVADILNRLDPDSCAQLLDSLDNVDPGVSDNVRRLMFVFEDLINLDANAMRELLARVDRKVLTTALKGTSDQLRKHIFDCQTQRSAEMLREDLEALGPVKIRDVDEAQQKVIAFARQLEKDGVLSLKGSSADEMVN